MAEEKPIPAMTQTPATPEGYTVLARRYRPQTFADIIGQEAVARALANALKSNRVAHAYLFTGARGVGKTSTARILAKALNCEKGPTATPCGQCDICTNIAAGEDVDVLEIDGASNNGVDNIRELRSNVQYMPQRSRFKIYIIDEVHMLSKGAFNALLKTLEEPPPHVKFIFATTEAEKVPITILSRCQRFDFAGIPVPRIVEHLRGIVQREGVQADDEALELVARRAGGSMRDAQSLLDQLLAFGGERLTADQVHALLGAAGDERIVALAETVLAHEVSRVLDLLDEAVVTGLQLGELLDQMIAYWRDLMVVHCAGVEGRDLSVPSRHRETLVRQAKALNLDAILAGLDILSAAKGQLKNSNHGRTLVEMALVRLGRLENLVALPELVRLLHSIGERGRVSAPSASHSIGEQDRVSAPSASRSIGERGRVSAPSASHSIGERGCVSAPSASHSIGEQGRVSAPSASLGALTQPRSPADSVALPEGTKKKSPASTPEDGAAGRQPLTPENLPEIWAQVLKKLPGMLARSLEKGELPAIIAPNNLALRFPIDYNGAKEQVEAALYELTGQPWLLRAEGLSNPASIFDAASSAGNVRGKAERGDSQSGGSSAVVAPRRNVREAAEKLPLVKRAIEVLGASFQRVDEGFGVLPSAGMNADEAPEEDDL